MKNALIFAVFSLFSFFIRAGNPVQIAQNPLFEKAVACIKVFEGWHTGPDYIGYGHKLLPGEKLTVHLTEIQADSLLRADLLKRYTTFGRF